MCFNKALTKKKCCLLLADLILLNFNCIIDRKWLKRLEEAKIGSSKKQCLIDDCSATTDDALLLRKEVNDGKL